MKMDQFDYAYCDAREALRDCIDNGCVDPPAAFKRSS
jgi:hypothetical protein